MASSDLLLPSAEFFTIAVHNAKDDPDAEQVTLHGLFTDKPGAETAAAALATEEVRSFLTFRVIPLYRATSEQVEVAQNLHPSFRADRLAREDAAR